MAKLKMSRSVAALVIAHAMATTMLSASAFAADWIPDGSRASGAIGTPVMAIKFTGLAAHAGKHLSVFYVNGRESAVGASGQILNATAVLAGPVTVVIPPSGEVGVPAVDVPRSGFTAMNYVVIGIHSQDNLFLRKGDGTPVKDVRLIDEAGSNVKTQEIDYEDRLRHVFISKLQQLKRGDIAIVKWESCSSAAASRDLSGC